MKTGQDTSGTLMMVNMGLIVGYAIIQSLFGKESVHCGNLSFHLLIVN